jgi:hypothetical protein
MWSLPGVAWIAARTVDLANLCDRVAGWVGLKEREVMGTILKLGVVGDLSLQDPQRLWRCLGAALAACDIVVQVGDCHPGYDQMKNAAGQASVTKQGFHAIPGNHDIDWDSKLAGWARTWRVTYDFPDKSAPACHLIGLDNSSDRFDPATRSVLSSVPVDGRPLLIFVHKPLSTIVLPDGSESGHIMGEGQVYAPGEADRMSLIEWVQGQQAHREVLLVHGHYHGWTLQLNAEPPPGRRLLDPPYAAQKSDEGQQKTNGDRHPHSVSSGAFIGPKGHNFIYKQKANDFIEVSTDGKARWSANPTLLIPADNLAIYNAIDLNLTYILLNGTPVTLGGNGSVGDWGWL